MFASAIEIFSVAAFLKESLSEMEFIRIKNLVSESAEKMSDWSIEKRKKNFVVCPLLVDDKCSVYEVRPLVCRGYTSYNKERCRQKTESKQPEMVIEGFLLQYLVPAYTRIGLQAAVESNGIQPFDIDLIRGLQRVLNDETLVEKWKAGKSVFDDIACSVPVPPELHGI